MTTKKLFWFSGMKLRKLKFIMYMITLYGTWHGIPSDIFFVGTDNFMFIFIF